jgi:hypothetical protein
LLETRPNLPIRFDWETRWLKGDEYAHILENRGNYSEAFKLKTFEAKTHPESIYSSPESKLYIVINNLDGMIYFVRGDSIGSDFGFPRLSFKKHYKW